MGHLEREVRGVACDLFRPAPGYVCGAALANQVVTYRIEEGIGNRLPVSVIGFGPMGQQRQLCAEFIKGVVVPGTEHGIADAVSKDAPCLLYTSQQSDQERPGDIQEVGGFLRRHLGVHRDQGDGIAMGHLGQQVGQKPRRRAGQGEDLAVIEMHPQLSLIHI